MNKKPMLSKLTMRLNIMSSEKYHDLRIKLVNIKGVYDTLNCDNSLVVIYDYSKELEAKIVRISESYNRGRFVYDTVIY